MDVVARSTWPHIRLSLCSRCAISCALSGDVVAPATFGSHISFCSIQRLVCSATPPCATQNLFENMVSESRGNRATPSQHPPSYVEAEPENPLHKAKDPWGAGSGTEASA
eukprot:1159221-Pelagomonas_calceolata.AAC.12